MIHIVKAFNVVNEAEVDIFLEFPCFVYDPVKVDSLISGSSAFSKSSLYICKFLVLEKTLESPLECKEVKPLNPKGNQSWIFIGRTDAELRFQYFDHLMGRTDSLEKTLTLGKIKGRRRGHDRGWDGWMASLTQWTWVWVNSGIWWWTGRPGMLQSIGLQRVGQDWATELNTWEFPGGSAVRTLHCHCWGQGFNPW